MVAGGLLLRLVIIGWDLSPQILWATALWLYSQRQNNIHLSGTCIEQSVTIWALACAMMIPLYNLDSLNISRLKVSDFCQLINKWRCLLTSLIEFESFTKIMQSVTELANLPVPLKKSDVLSCRSIATESDKHKSSISCVPITERRCSSISPT